MKKSVVAFAAVLMMMGGTFAFAQQPEGEAPATTEQPAPTPESSSDEAVKEDAKSEDAKNEDAKKCDDGACAEKNGSASTEEAK